MLSLTFGKCCGTYRSSTTAPAEDTGSRYQTRLSGLQLWKLEILHILCCVVISVHTRKLPFVSI